MLRRKFIWGQTNDRKIHLVPWDRLCQPKCNRGLDIQLGKSYNEAIIMKLSWDVFRSHNSFSVDVLQNKYEVHGNNNGESSLWKAIQSQQDSIMKAMAWALGNGTKVRFWLDHWAGMGSNLITVATSHIPDEEIFKLVSDYISEQGQWRWDCFVHWLPSSMIMNIASIKPLSLTDGEESLYWGCSKSGLFTVKYAFSLLEGSKWDMKDRRWSAIWQWKGPD